MIKEPIFKKTFIEKLNQINSGWIDGDKENGTNMKVDILNHQLKLAIEIKDDTKYKIIADGIVRVNSLKLMNERFSDHLKSANKKFKIYPDYRTVLLFRTEYIAGTVKYAIEGLDQFKKVDNQLVNSGKVGKYSEFAKNEIGGFLIFNDKVGYFENYLAKPKRILSSQEIISFTGLDINNI